MPVRLYILCSEKCKTDLIVFFFRTLTAAMNLRMPGFGNIHCWQCTVHTIRVLYIIITVKCDCWCFDLKRSTSRVLRGVDVGRNDFHNY